DPVGYEALRNAVERQRHALRGEGDAAVVENQPVEADTTERGFDLFACRSGRICPRCGEMTGMERPQRLDRRVEHAAACRPDVAASREQDDQLARRRGERAGGIEDR